MKLPMSEVTQLLREWNAGEPEARDRLMRLVYDPLHAIAERHFGREREGHTLQPTALVHELYVRFADQRHVAFRDRVHFFAVAATVMRRILVDHARRRGSDKRGGGETPLAIDWGGSAEVERLLSTTRRRLGFSNIPSGSSSTPPTRNGSAFSSVRIASSASSVRGGMGTVLSGVARRR